MRKIKVLALTLLFGTGAVMGNPVESSVAQKVAQNFYASKYSAPASVGLVYTERDNNGVPVYYVFNVNANQGFVIVTAEDAAHPIIGYSNEGPFVVPAANNNVDFWLQRRKKEVIAMRAQNITASSDITEEWTAYTNGKRYTHNQAPTSVGPLCVTYWDQSPYYNAYCPGGSVTGCVATAMAQIMKYWGYPSVGLGSSCYYDETQYGYQESYGQLCATYDTSHYAWAKMQDTPLGDSNNEIAKLMYDCGVSVDMDYSPTGSGASVAGGAPSAQNSYVEYFGYDGSTINFALYNNYTEANWITLLENELNNKRPMQFQGFTSSMEGHSWVCDGYSASNEVHMNWGWSGIDDGYYAVNDLNAVGEYDFTEQIGMIYGIEPPPGALAVPQVSDKTSITVYPNPSHGIFNFNMPGSNNSYMVKVYNVLGQEINTSLITTENNEINLGNEAKGIYTYRIQTEKGEIISTGKLVVE
jgi:hypothetical protein